MGNKLYYFSDFYDIDEFDERPLPQDIYNNSGAILAAKGSKLPKHKLKHTFIFNAEEAHDSRFSSRDSSSVLFSSSQEATEYYQYLHSEDYEEEVGQVIVSRLDQIDFETTPEVKKCLRQNIFQLKELYEKKIFNNAIHLSTENNAAISQNISTYLDNILGSYHQASEYMELLQSIRTPDNYITFSHSNAIAFYTLAITRKLTKIQEDLYIRPNLGKWLPVATHKHRNQVKALNVPHQILKYMDLQKESILVKYPKEIQENLLEMMHDLLYEYGELKPQQQYPSLMTNYDEETRQMLSIAALNCDLGKRCLPNKILNKQEELDTEDWKLIKEHPLYSVSKLKELTNYPQKILGYILAHHNLDNELGYPLFKRQLPPETKIITIADMYDAMTAPKHYGKKHTHSEAMEELSLLYQKGYFDLPLFLAAKHTFEEFNHPYLKNRQQKIKYL